MPSKPLRALLAEFSWETWPIVFGELSKRGALAPVYWSGTATFKDQVTAAFPDCVYQDSMDASRGENPLGGGRLPSRWTAAMLKVWKEDAQDILAMLNRADLEGAFDLPARLDYIAHQLALWDNVLDQLRPDVAVFSAPPHVGYDYILFRLCRARKIKTLILEWCLYGPHMFFWETLEDGDVAFREKYRARLTTLNTKPIELSERGSVYLSQLRGKHEDAAAAHYPDMNRQVFGDNPYRQPGQESRGPLKLLKAEGLQFRQRVYDFIWWQYYLLDDGRRRLRSLPSVPWESAFVVEKDLGFRNAVQGPFVRSRLFRKYRKWLRTAYDREETIKRKAQPIPRGQPFVFLALHQQPERTTSPQGGVFVDQMKIIEMLSAALPAGWKLVVKEHMSQLNPAALGHMSRQTSFYEKAAALPNVVLVAPRLPPSLLIDACSIVATVSGTVGWESVIRGKPVFIFGAAWYRDCEGVFRIHDFESCQEALSKIIGGYEVDARRVEAFLEVIEKSQIEALPQPPLALCSLSLEENARRLVTALEDQLH